MLCLKHVNKYIYHNVCFIMAPDSSKAINLSMYAGVENPPILLNLKCANCFRWINQSCLTVVLQVLSNFLPLKYRISVAYPNKVTMYQYLTPSSHCTYLHSHVSSVADPGCLSRIRIFPSRIKKTPDPGSASNNLTKNIVSKIWCSSRIRILLFYPSRIPDQGSKRHRIPDPDPQHCI